MNDLNWLLVLVAFLAGVVFTLLWSLRAVTRKVAAKSAHPAPDTEVPEADQDPASALEDVALVAVGIEAPTEPAIESSTDSTPAVDDAETVSWWDQAFVANRPEPVMSPTEQEPGTERSYGGTANRDLLGPAGERIKGNRDSMLYHTIASPYYGRTIAEAWFATEADAEAAGFTRWDRRKSTARLAPAAADPAPVAAPKVRNGKPARNGKAARGTIKGNRGSMLYHTVESPYYDRTKAEEWFASETEASAAGYRRWDHKRAQRG